MDAVRLIAIVGVILWLVPVLWPSTGLEEPAPITMSRALFYVFGVWVGLIAVAALLAFRIRRLPAEPEEQETDP
jgi:nitrate reductase gamma subunit